MSDWDRFGHCLNVDLAIDPLKLGNLDKGLPFAVASDRNLAVVDVPVDGAAGLPYGLCGLGQVQSGWCLKLCRFGHVRTISRCPKLANTERAINPQVCESRFLPYGMA